MTSHRSLNQTAIRPTDGIATPGEIRWPQVVMGILALITVVLVATHLSEGEKLWQLLRQLQPLRLSTAVGLQMGTYVCVALMLHQAVLRDGEPVPVHRLFLLALAKQFVSQAVPSIGLSGNLMVIRGLQRRGVSRATAVRAVLVVMFGYFLAFAVALGAALVILWIQRELYAAILIPLTVLLLVMVGATVAVFWLGERAPRILPRRIRNWLIRRDLEELIEESNASGWTAGPLVQMTSLQLTIFLLDAATLFVVLGALGIDVEPTIVVAALVSAEAVASIGLVPAGLGTFEGTCVAVLHAHGVGIEAALAGTVILRGLTFWLPMLPGFWIARHEVGDPHVDDVRV